MEPHYSKIGMREFRQHLPKYLKSDGPVAITCHGETVGFYIPTKQPKHTDIEGLKRAALELEKLLRANSISEDEIVAEYRALREKK